MSDLTDRMHTCAAHILARKAEGDPWAVEVAATDAANLLIEAAAILSGLLVPLPPGEPSIEAKPMEVIPPVPEGFVPLAGTVDWHAPGGPAHVPLPTWVAPGGPLPGVQRSGTISRNACPKCDSRAAKKVYRQGNSIVLECPVCGHAWKRA